MKLTEAAANKIMEVLALQKAYALRVMVKGGGCSGFQYAFKTEQAHTIAEDDQVIEHGGVTLVIDPISAEYLSDSELDFKDDGLSANFILRNPRAVSQCGCGASFAI